MTQSTRRTPDVPLALPAGALALGLALGAAGPAGPAALAAPLLLAGAAWPRARIGAWSLLLGLLLGRGDALLRAPPGDLLRAPLPQVHRVEGVVVGTGLPSRGALRLRVAIDTWGEPPRPLGRVHEIDVTLAQRGRSRWRWHELGPGARIAALMRLRNRRDGIVGSIHDRRAVEILAPADGAGAELARVRRRASWALGRALDRRDAGLARALLLGDRGRLDRGDRTLFRTTGQAHLLAVSGLHVGLLLAGLVLILRFCGAPLRLIWSLGLIAALFVVPFTGAPPSAVRAGLGASAWFIARLCGRAPRGLAVLALVAVLVLVSEPASVASISFQLSFAAVLGILLLAPRLRSRLVKPQPVVAGLLPPRRAPLRTAFSVSLAAWLATAPFVAAHIGRLCPAGPVLSIPSIPLTAVLLATGMTVLLFGGVGPIAAAAAWIFEQAAQALRGLLEGATSLGLDAGPVGVPTVAWWVLYVGVFLLAVTQRGRAVSMAVLALLLLLAVLCTPPAGNPLVAARPARSVARAAYHAPAVHLSPLSTVEPIRDFLGLLAVGGGLLVFGLAAVALRWLGARAAAAAWLVGLVATWQFGLGGLAGLMAPFLGATLLGKLPGSERAGARNLRQVLCNGTPALLGCLLAATGWPDLGGAFFLGSLACLGADTCATEVGVRWGGTPFRLLGRGPVRRGESGGVTLAGLLASLGGAALAPATFALVTAAPWEGAGLLAAAGVAGGLLDSVLGGTLQFRGRHPDSGEVVEQPFVNGAPTEAVRGWRWLDNDAVNLLTGLAAAVIAVLLATYA